MLSVEVGFIISGGEDKKKIMKKTNKLIAIESQGRQAKWKGLRLFQDLKLKSTVFNFFKVLILFFKN